MREAADGLERKAGLELELKALTAKYDKLLNDSLGHAHAMSGNLLGLALKGTAEHDTGFKAGLVRAAEILEGLNLSGADRGSCLIGAGVIRAEVQKLP